MANLLLCPYEFILKLCLSNKLYISSVYEFLKAEGKILELSKPFLRKKESNKWKAPGFLDSIYFQLSQSYFEPQSQ